MYASYRGYLAKALVMWRWRRGPTKIFWTPLGNASSIGRITASQRRDWVGALPALPGQTCRWKFGIRCMPHLYKEALAIAQDAHQWALVATALLEEKIERLSCSLSHGCQHSRGCKHSGSCFQRYQAGSHQGRAPQAEVHQGGHLRDGPNPPALGGPGGASPLRTALKRTPELGSPVHLPGETWMKPGWKKRTLGPASPQPLPGRFPGQSWGGDDPQQALPPKPSHKDSAELVRWQVTLTWWQEVYVVPGQSDIQEFVRRGQASFQLPLVSSHAQGVTNDYLAPPAPPWNGTDFCPSLMCGWGAGLPPETAPKDPSLCQGSPVLGTESPATNNRHVSSTGGECTGAPMRHGTSYLIHRCRGSGWQITFQLESHPHRHQSLQIPQLLRNEATAGAVGLRPEMHLQWPMA